MKLFIVGVYFKHILSNELKTFQYVTCAENETAALSNVHDKFKNEVNMSNVIIMNVSIVYVQTKTFFLGRIDHKCFERNNNVS